MNNKQNYGKSVIEGALSLTISSLVVKLLGLFYKIPLSYMLSDEGMGYFNSAYTVYTFFYIICTAGVPKAISILTSQAEGEGDKTRVRNIYRTAFNMFFTFGILITAVFFFAASPLSSLIGNSGSYFTMIAIAPSILFTCASGVIRGYFNGSLSFIPIAVSEVISGASKLVLGLLFAMLGHRMGCDLTLLSAFTITGTTFGSFFGYLYLLICKNKEKDRVVLRQKTKTVFFSSKIAKSICKIAIPITLTSAIGSISGIIDLTIIMKRLADAGYTELQAGIFYGNYTTLAIPMLNLISTLIAPLSAVLLPLVSKNSIKNDKIQLSERISFTVKILCFISIPISVLFLIRPKELLSILFEDASAVMAAPLLSMLAPGIIFMCLLTVINTALEGTGKTKIPLISLLVGSIVKFVISYTLIGNSEIGILGAPIGTTVSYFVSFCISAYYILAVQKVKISFISSIIPVLLSSIIAGVACTALMSLLNISNIWIYSLDIAVFALIYMILLSIMRFYSFRNLLNLAKYTKKR